MPKNLSGGGGIRTHGASQLTRFQGAPVRPLRYSTALYYSAPRHIGAPGAPAEVQTVAKFPAEASPSPVYGAGLLIPLGGNPLASSNLAASAPRSNKRLVLLGWNVLRP